MARDLILLKRLSAAALLLAIVYAVLLLPGTRAASGYNPLVDGWLNIAFRVAAIAVLFVRSRIDPRERAAWLFLCGGLAVSTAASVTYFVHYQYVEQPPAVSVADVGWLVFYPLIYAGIVLFLRARVPRLLRSLWLDGFVAGLTAAALAAAILGGRGGPFAGASTAGLIIFYPFADLILFALTVAAIVILGRTTDRVWWLLCGSFLAYAVTDAAYAAAVVNNAYTAGLLDLGWLLARLGLVVAAWTSVRPDAQAKPAEFGGIHVLVVPGVCMAVVLGLLFSAAMTPLPLLAASLSLVAGAAVVARTLLTFREVRDLTELRRQARTDDLTGLPNRRAFTEAVQRALRQRSPRNPLALLVIDLDSFKEVNETFGHHRGDELLSMLAPRLQLANAAPATVARIGGDEFAVLLDEADAVTAETLAERLRSVCRGPFTIESRPLHMNASVGIALFPQDGEDPTSLLQHADIALSTAKEESTGHSFYRPDHHRASRARIEEVEELRAAIASEQFVLHYQPKVALADERVVGVEALVRWQHPTRGLLGPHLFLPQLERAGLMQSLTVSLLNQALAQWRAWELAGTSTTVAVNLSVSDLLDPSLPYQVARALERHSAPGSALILELTEDLLLADPARGGAVVESLSSLGVHVQVDDYGTGFSTLGYLRDLPTLHGLKLDRSFVTRVADDRRSEAIVASTIALAADLGLELVAEGIETEETRQKLVALGCPQAQGYLFGRPVPPEQVLFRLSDVRTHSDPQRPRGREPRAPLVAPQQARPPALAPPHHHGPSYDVTARGVLAPKGRWLTVSRVASLALILTVLLFTAASATVVIRDNETSRVVLQADRITEGYADLEAALLRQEVTRHDLILDQGDPSELVAMQRDVAQRWDRLRRLESGVAPAAAHGSTLMELRQALTTYQDAVSEQVQDLQSGAPVAEADSVTHRLAGDLLAQVARERADHRADASAATDQMRRSQQRAAQILPVLGVLCLLTVGACVRLLSAQRRRLAKLREQAHLKAVTDDLTGLANRDGLRAALHEAPSDRGAGHTTGLLLLDLDSFRTINDTYGHGLGDEVLQVVANRLRETAPEGSLVARLGGDEFVILIPDVDSQEVMRIATQVAAALAAPAVVQSVQTDVSASIGVALSDGPSEMSEALASELLRRADIAMYAAKTASNGPVLFSDLLGDRIADGRR